VCSSDLGEYTKTVFGQLFLVLISGSSVLHSYGQSHFDFDQIRPSLKKGNLAESEKIKQWLKKNVQSDPMPAHLYTRACQAFLSGIPDDIELMNEKSPGLMERNFRKKWGRQFDMERIPGPNPFSSGNGGCSNILLGNLDYLGFFPNNRFY